jgi:hypothetical protein
VGCEKEDLIKHEQYFLDSHNPYFNTCRIANSQLGNKRSEESKQRMRHPHKKFSEETKQRLKGRHLSEETIQKMRERVPWNKGCKTKEETKIKLRKPKIKRNLDYKRVCSEETKAKLRKVCKPPSRLGVKHSEEAKQKMREVRRLKKLKQSA